ncbi:MAG: amidase [Chitinophagaceae bacterium]
MAGSSLFLTTLLHALALSSCTSHPLNLEEITVDQLQDLMAKGSLTAEQLTQAYLDRIAQIDKQGPQLNAVIEVNPDAIKIARELDQERKNGKLRGPLHGIPVLIKDNIDTGDQMMTTAGSLALEGNRATQDAFIARQLRLSGAVILGKTNLSEFANFRSSRSTSGWSSRGGQTRNPYLLDRNPCGSSSGTGTAVAANLCALGIGTETNGSIACPSSVNGIVGIKPTVGLWSRSGIIPISATQDTAGPMARTVRDAALLLGVCTGVDPRDERTKESEGKFLTDYGSSLDAKALLGKRIGIDKNAGKVQEDVAAVWNKALDQLRQQGATIVEVDFDALVKNIGSDEHKVLCYEFKDGLNRYLSTANAKVKTLKDIIAYNQAHADTVMPYFKQDLLEESDQKGTLDSPEYLAARDKIVSTCRTAIDATLELHQLDALLSPGDGPSWCTDWVNGDAFVGNSYYWPAAIAGYPHITVPMGIVHELPVCLCFIGEAWSESKLIGLAYSYEQASIARKAPKYLPSIAAAKSSKKA